MKPVILLAEAVEDLEQAREFYDKREESVGDYCVTSLLADVSSSFHSAQFQAMLRKASKPFALLFAA